MHELAALNARHGIAGQVIFMDGPGGLVLAEINNAHASATLALQGAQLLRWAPHGQSPAVWLSRAARYTPGKSIRGGAPVCWPWFGPHATDAGLPAHGYARTVPWEVIETRALDDGATELALALVESDKTRAMWPHRARLSLRAIVGRTLKLALATVNAGEEDFVIGEALHTYFAIGDIGDIRIAGLDGAEYLDKAGGGSVRRRQDGPVSFAAETDRIYLNTEAECVIEDARLKRRIRIAKRGSRSTVVWNPWAAKADKMGDLGPDGWRGMVCVESANAADDVVRVEAGASHTLAVEYRVEPL
jgi:glucose-6-phosphate 1-epimerase